MRIRSRLLGYMIMCSLASYGCGDSTPHSADASPDAKGDTGAGGSGAAAGDAAADRATGSPDATDGGTDGPASDGGPGTDGAVATCSDGVKNSDETGIDCGGHCGQCGPGKGCLAATDCQFGICKTDGTCGACSVATDCSGTESECQHRTCTAGVCGLARDTAGTVLSVQTTGDCKRRQCAADGTVAIANDDTDLPDDKNACTNDLCGAGAPSHTMVAANTACGGTNRCNASGLCVGCTAAADCAGTDTACRTRTCSTAGVCGLVLMPAGTRLTDPTPGDCKGLQCDGNGNSQISNDGTDLPVDNNPCTTDLCNVGTPSHQPVAAQTTCGTGLVCDGATHCVQCLSASTCPGTDAECHTRTCLSGQCDISNLASGTVLATQTPKDCKKRQCNGMGAAEVVTDDTDLPIDGNACTYDVCTQGMTTNPFVTAGTTCSATSICDGQGACVGCVTAANCPGTDTECHTRTCLSSTCGISNLPAGTLLFSQTAGDCKKSQCDGAGASQIVADNTDKPVDGNACTQDLCNNGTPSNPLSPSGTTCGTNLLCNAQGACVGCLAASDCPGTDTACRTRACVNGQCTPTNAAAGTVIPTQTPGDCKRQQCDGAGQIATVADDTDKPVDGNDCTQDLCSAGLASNPFQTAGTTCSSQTGGSKCNATGACVQCLQVSDCAGSDTECQIRTCTNGMCGTSNTADNTPVSLQMAGDCHKNVCLNGLQTSVVDNSDAPNDSKACTMDVCLNGTGSNPPQPAAFGCNENGGSTCDGAGNCVTCLIDSACGSTNTCQTNTCVSGACVVTNAASGTLVSSLQTGDCQKQVCDGAGGAHVVADDTDLPSITGQCVTNACTMGVPSNPPLAKNTPCTANSGTKCDGAGTCVQCFIDSECPGGNGDCALPICTNGVCGIHNSALGTVASSQTSGDCKTSQCDGNGGYLTVANDADPPAPTGQCVLSMCMGGSSTTSNSPHGTTCTENSGRTCDGLGTCLLTFDVVRVGDGGSALTSAATPVFVEERKFADGTLVGTATPLPTASVGSNSAFTNSGSAGSEDGLSLSANGRYLTLAGYNATPGTLGIVGTPSATNNRVVARIDAAGNVDTSTRLSGAFNMDNVRGVTSSDGSAFWVGGNGATSTGGVWYVTFGSSGAALQLIPTGTLANTRWPHIFGGQLYSTANSGNFNGVFTVGTLLPTTAPATPTVLPGVPPTGNQPYSFVFFDLDGNGTYETLYVADDGSASTRGIQKWTLAAGTWTKAATNFNLPTAAKFEGLAGVVTGSSVTLVGSTDEALPRLVTFVDPGSGTPAGTVIGTAATNMTFRGVALAPHL